MFPGLQYRRGEHIIKWGSRVTHIPAWMGNGYTRGQQQIGQYLVRLRKEEMSNFILYISSSRLMIPRANYLHDGSSSILAIGRCAHLSLHLRKFLLSLMEMFHLHKFLNSCGKNYCNYNKYFFSNFSVLLWKFVVSGVEFFCL